MKKKVRKTILISLSVIAFLFVVLCIHIYVVMKPHPADASTIAMARIDLKQNITKADGDKIASWLYSQQGVQHVLCNPQTRIVVFTFYPVRVSADKLTEGLSSLNYKAVRYIPSKESMQSGCPVAGSSFAYKIYNFINNI